MRKPSIVFLLCAILLLGFASCDKHEYEGIRGVSEYAPLKPGNYWVYGYHTVDAAGNEVVDTLMGPLNAVDSVYVEKDTMVNGFLYHKVVDQLLPPEQWLLRDSSNYLVTATGLIRLAPADFTHVLYEEQRPGYPVSPDSVLFIQLHMADWDKEVQTPAGTFKTTSLDEIYTSIPYAGTGGARSERRRHLRYAKNVGLVTETMPFYYSTPYYQERRLLRYHLN